MKIESFEVKNPLLKGYIECVYVIDNASNDSTNSFFILPSIDAYLSFSLHTQTVFKENEVTTTFCAKNEYESSIQIGLYSPTLNRYVGQVKEICIRFKPLGLFYFFEEKQIWSALDKTYFLPDEAYISVLSEAIQLTDAQTMIQKIESYLSQRYTAFSHPFLKEIVNEIMQHTDIDASINFQVLSEKAHITRQTLHTHFKKYLNHSPSDFKQIYRFRKFVELKLKDKNEKNSMNVLYDVGFFDQSHLIKFFRKKSLQNPLHFFNNLYVENNQRILVLWQ
jgi:AraC-like DNA-binding protein